MLARVGGKDYTSFPPTLASISLTMLTLGTQHIAKPTNIPHNAMYNID